MTFRIQKKQINLFISVRTRRQNSSVTLRGFVGEENGGLAAGDSSLCVTVRCIDPSVRVQWRCFMIRSIRHTHTDSYTDSQALGFYTVNDWCVCWLQRPSVVVLTLYVLQPSLRCVLQQDDTSSGGGSIKILQYTVLWKYSITRKSAALIKKIRRLESRWSEWVSAFGLRGSSQA